VNAQVSEVVSLSVAEFAAVIVFKRTGTSDVDIVGLVGVPPMTMPAPPLNRLTKVKLGAV
jgi:hypothetical protein